MASDSAENRGNPLDSELAFTDDVPTVAEPAQLPSWLQNFADVTGHDLPPAGMAAGPGPADSLLPVTPVDASAPAGLPSQQASVAFDSGVSTDFFGEDDLPEWLRALNTELPADERQLSLDAVSDEDESQSMRVPSPDIADVWLTGREVWEPSPAASLFASIAQALDDRPVESGAGAEAPSPMRPKTREAVEAEPEAKQERVKWSRKIRLLFGSVIAAMVVFVAILANSAG